MLSNRNHDGLLLLLDDIHYCMRMRSDAWGEILLFVMGLQVRQESH